MRRPRELRNHASYHVTARINRQELLLESEKIKKMLLAIVQRAKGKYGFSIKNFCIMGNHIHFIIKPLKKSNLSKIMQWILSVFAMRYNRMFHLTGHVWYDRFSSKIISGIRQYLATFIYIAKNPVESGIVKHATDYVYSGIYCIHKGFLGILDRPPNCILKLVWPKILH
ncbi:MAG: hypothetical protein E4H36_09395 [Spirochaetales bacterium]|nr:MAG: hypothetical protein E4H36_09395 [Spirochaetales bacterium]